MALAASRKERPWAVAHACRLALARCDTPKAIRHSRSATAGRPAPGRAPPRLCFSLSVFINKKYCVTLHPRATLKSRRSDSPPAGFQSKISNFTLTFQILTLTKNLIRIKIFRVALSFIGVGGCPSRSFVQPHYKVTTFIWITQAILINFRLRFYFFFGHTDEYTHDLSVVHIPLPDRCQRGAFARARGGFTAWNTLFSTHHTHITHWLLAPIVV